MTDHVALLRGINVGGRNKVRMADLREAVADLGGKDVETYIASGNVLYRGAVGASELEAGLSERFGIELKVVVLTAAQLREVVGAAPPEFDSDELSCDVVFLRRPLTARRAFGLFDLREGIDQAWTGPGVVFHARLAARASGSRFGRITEHPEYKEMTIRSWSTTTRLDALMWARRGP